MTRLRKLICLCLLPALTAACSDDDYVYPDVITEIVCLQTDETGTIRYLLTDEGTEWAVQQRAELEGLVADTTYRALTMYALPGAGTDKREVHLYSSRLAIAPVPLPAEKFKEIKTDPVELQSIWPGGGYLNLVVVARVKDQAHGYQFIENGITRHADGKKTLDLTLYHDRNNDIEGFDRKVYLSVPLWAYADVLQEGDTLAFHVNTYKEGMATRTFIYQNNRSRSRK